jgi:DNA polymerase V
MTSAAPASGKETFDDIYLRPLFLSRVQAGPPSPADDTVEERINLNRFIFRNPAATTLYRVRDGSLRVYDVFEGDLLVIDRSLAPEAGRLVLFEAGGVQAVALLVKARDRLFLDCGAAGAGRVELRRGDEGPKLLGVVTHSIHTLDE